MANPIPPRADKPFDPHLEAARISMKQAVLVAVISAAGGVLTALVTTGAFKNSVGSVKDAAATAQLEQKYVELQGEVNSSKKKVDELHTTKLKLEEDLHQAIVDLQRERQRTAMLESDLEQKRKQLASFALEVKSQSAPPSIKEAPVAGKKIALYYTNNTAPTVLAIKKKLESLGATVSLQSGMFVDSPFDPRKSFVYYRKDGDLEAALFVKDFLKPHGLQDISTAWNDRDPYVGNLDLAVAIFFN